MTMTQDQFNKARKQLGALSVAVQERERFMRHAIAFYAAGNYEFAMLYQFMFLMYMDDVDRRAMENWNTDAPKLLCTLIEGRVHDHTARP